MRCASLSRQQCRQTPAAVRGVIPATLTGLLLTLMLGPVAVGQMATHGPMNQFGFPAYYTDYDGTTVVHGTDPGDPLLLNCVCDLPDPTAPLDVATGNFFEETFYWEGNTSMLTAGGFASIRMTLQGVFLNLAGTVVDGDQGVFSRVRIRADIAADPANAGTYTVTHPYGVEVFELTELNLGIRAINFTINSTDIMAAGEEFTTPLDAARSPIGPGLLRWTEGAPPGYVGDPNLLHAVQGSPLGTNVFRIEGPNIGGPGINIVETNLFFIAGKVGIPTPAWADMGQAMQGSGGIPKLVGSGTLIPDTTMVMTLRNALPDTATMLLIGSANVGLPLMGGILVPSPDMVIPLVTGPTGILQVAGPVSSGASLGVTLYFQHWIADPAGPEGWVASNAVAGTFP